MRAVVAGALLLTIGCGGPTGSRPSPTPVSSSVSSPTPSQAPSPTPLPSPTHFHAPVAGGVVEYPIVLPDASPSGMTAGPDGRLWFVDVGNPSKVGRVSLSGAIVEFDVPGSVGGPETITAGPDGNVWMAASGGGVGAASWILKISPGGVVRKFSVPGAAPNGITTGPDGNIWFTEFFNGRIGQMTTSGVLIREFQIPGAAPRGIVTGPDGNLWFTEASPQGSAIVRMTLSGEFTEFPMVSGPSNQLNPTAIVAGPDGNIWFTEAGGGKIGRVTPTGEITEFAVPNNRSPLGLAVGPDGNLWFTASGDSAKGAIGRITPSGTIRLFQLPRRGSEPIGIAAGADGRMWFTEAGVNQIGSIGETVPEAGLTSVVMDFGTESVVATRTLTITNPGDAPLNISGLRITGRNSTAFAVTRDVCTGRPVAIHSSCSVDVTFAPGTDQGVLAAQLKVTDNASGSPQMVSLVAQLPACRLRVFTRSEGSPVQLFGWFLNLRNRFLEPEASGRFDFDQSKGLYRSREVPILSGTFPAHYDAVAKRWLPTTAASVAPDHSRYAYVDFSGGIDRRVHVVDVVDGRDRVLNFAPGPWSVLAFGKDGIYVNQSYEATGPGLTLVDPDTGAARKLFAGGAVFQVGDGAAWIGTRNTHDPLPEPPGIGGAFNEVVRRDLVTGQSERWFYASGANLHVAAIAGGRLLVTGYFKHGSRTWIVSGPNQAERLTVPGTGEDFSFDGGFISDDHGVWLHGLDGVYLWRPGAGLTLFSSYSAIPAGSCS